MDSLKSGCLHIYEKKNILFYETFINMRTYWHASISRNTCRKNTQVRCQGRTKGILGSQTLPSLTDLHHTALSV